MQVAFLALFVALLLAAGYPLTSPIPVDLFLRTDPLAALTTIISSRVLVPTVLWSLALVLLTIPLGRVFCGWACPLGTVLDGLSFAFRNGEGKRLPRWRNLKTWILVAVVVASLFTLQLAWLADPLALLTRTAVLSLLPMAAVASTAAFGALFGIESLQDTLLRLQMALSSTLLPDQPALFRWSGTVLVVFLAALGLEFVSRRFWCRNLCPLGALYGLLSTVQLLRRRVTEKCTDCGRCAPRCKMDAIGEDARTTLHAECILCWNCVKVCPERSTAIDFSRKPARPAFDLSRRGLLVSSAAGLGSVLLVKTGYVDAAAAGKLIRPPGALEEGAFLDRCIRCHECVRVCSTSGRLLQPASLEGGLEAFWTPMGVCRTGWCEVDCVMCTEVCPTGAIRRLDVGTKKRLKIGLASIDRSRCIPWYRAEGCLVCQEHCPTSPKAILLRDEAAVGPGGKTLAVKRPYIDETLCIGCGICETKCPLAGVSAIVVTTEGEERQAP